jgi:hypothetical protein
MQEYLAYQMTAGVDRLYFLSCNILALLQFEDVLPSVDDFQGIGAWQNHADVSSPEPSVGCDSLCSFLFILVISHKN